MHKLAPVLTVLGKMVMLLAVTMLLPLLVSDLTDDGASAAFHWGMAWRARTGYRYSPTSGPPGAGPARR